MARSLNLDGNYAVLVFQTIQEGTGGVGKANCLRVFQTRTLDVISSDFFMRADIATICSIYEQPELTINSELDLFKALYTYARMRNALPGHTIEGNQEAFEIFVRPALRHIRFLTLPVEEMARNKLFEIGLRHFLIKNKYFQL